MNTDGFYFYTVISIIQILGKDIIFWGGKLCVNFEHFLIKHSDIIGQNEM